jgi:Uma2 family endonuclease
MGRIAERSKLSPEEYLAWERQQECKHEYFDGEVFAMAGGSYRHNRLIMKVGFALEPNLAARGCTVVASDQRVRARHRRYVYPDVTVVCGAPALEHDDVLTNPTILVEVLSSTTEQYDRGLKWDSYQALTSLTDYILVSQDRAHIEHFARIDNRWIYASANAGDRITLTNGIMLDVDAIFAGVFDLPGD